MDSCGFGQPHVAVDASALVEPTITKGGIHSYHQYVARAVMHEVADVEAEGSVAVIISPDEAAIDEYEGAPKGTVEFEYDAAAEVGGGNVETAPIPADRGFRILSAERLVAVALERFVAHKGQLDSPVVRQVQGAPPGSVERFRRELEIPCFGEVALAGTEAEVP